MLEELGHGEGITDYEPAFDSFLVDGIYGPWYLAPALTPWLGLLLGPALSSWPLAPASGS